jgi:hypothetical protein
MGEHDISAQDEQQAQRFTRALLADLTALEAMDSSDLVARGKTPQLAALRLHNGTVWRCGQT